MQSTITLPGPNEFPEWLRARRRQLQRLLRGPGAPAGMRGKTIARREEGELVIERVAYDGEAGEQIPALMISPRKANFPLPLIIYLHSRGANKEVGKSEILSPDISGQGVGGKRGLQNPAPTSSSGISGKKAWGGAFSGSAQNKREGLQAGFMPSQERHPEQSRGTKPAPTSSASNSEFAGPSLAAELCHRGYVVLAPDSVGYEERKEDNEEVEAGRLLLQGWSLAAKLAWEVSRAVDYANTRPEVGAGRIGVLGRAQGGMTGWLAAAAEARISTIAVCWGASTYASVLNEHIALGPAGWIPNLFDWGDVPEVCCLIAPRPLFFCASQKDPVFPIAGFNEVYWRVSQLYLRIGEEEKLSQYITEAAEFDKETRARVANWFDKWL